MLSDVLSAREERVLLGHDVTVLLLRAQLPHAGDDAQHDDAHDGGVLPPVGGLAVPATGRRPDVLGVAVDRQLLERYSRCLGGSRRRLSEGRSD